MPARLTALVLAVAACASVARAQDASPPEDAAPADPRLDEARDRQARGRALLDAGDANGALAEFEAVYTLLEGHPRRFMALANIGRAHQTLGQYDRAMTYYERYLEEGGPDAEDRAAVQAAIDALASLLGTVTITTNVPEAEVWIDNRRVGAAPGDVRVPGGVHALELRAAGHAPSRREVEVVARRSLAIAIELEPIGEGGGVDPAFFFAGLGVTGATGAVALTIGGLFLARQAETSDRIADGTAATSDLDAERELALVADVLFGVTGALAVATVVLGVVADWGGDDAPPVEVTLAPLPGGAAVGIAGRLE